MGWIFGNKFSLRTLQRVFATGAFVALGPKCLEAPASTKWYLLTEYLQIGSSKRPFRCPDEGFPGIHQILYTCVFALTSLILSKCFICHKELCVQVVWGTLPRGRGAWRALASTWPRGAWCAAENWKASTGQLTPLTPITSIHPPGEDKEEEQKGWLEILMLKLNESKLHTSKKYVFLFCPSHRCGTLWQSCWDSKAEQMGHDWTQRRDTLLL